MDEEKGPATGRARLAGFATWHIVLSFLLAPVLFLTVTLWGENERLSILLWMGLMGVYFPLGMGVAALEKWTAPSNFRERAGAVLVPAAIAWGWVMVVIFTLWWENANFVLLIFFFSAAFASPSSVAVLISLQFIPNGMGFFPWIAWMGAITGLLPPLFFGLGSWWQGARNGRVRVHKDPTGAHGGP